MPSKRRGSQARQVAGFGHGRALVRTTPNKFEAGDVGSRLFTDGEGSDGIVRLAAPVQCKVSGRCPCILYGASSCQNSFFLFAPSSAGLRF